MARVRSTLGSGFGLAEPLKPSSSGAPRPPPRSTCRVTIAKNRQFFYRYPPAAALTNAILRILRKSPPRSRLANVLAPPSDNPTWRGWGKVALHTSC